MKEEVSTKQLNPFKRHEEGRSKLSRAKQAESSSARDSTQTRCESTQKAKATEERGARVGITRVNMWTQDSFLEPLRKYPGGANNDNVDCTQNSYWKECKERGEAGVLYSWGKKKMYRASNVPKREIKLLLSLRVKKGLRREKN